VGGEREHLAGNGEIEGRHSVEREHRNYVHASGAYVDA
jgi:hypothetical protein